MPRETCYRFTPEEAAAEIPTPEGKRFTTLLRRGSIEVEFYRPVGEDLQTPHARDECYVVVEGSGTFEMGGQRVPFRPGDFLFVPAGVEHRFEDFGETMSAWVVFYGPDGGEEP